MKFSDLLGDEQPEDGAAAADAPEPIGVFTPEKAPAAVPDTSSAAIVEPAPPVGVGRTAHLAAVNVAPVAAPVAAAPEDDGAYVAQLGAFDDDLLPSARTHRNRR